MRVFYHAAIRVGKRDVGAASPMAESPQTCDEAKGCSELNAGEQEPLGAMQAFDRAFTASRAQPLHFVCRLFRHETSSRT